MYASLKNLYKSMMFPQQAHVDKWTLTEIDQLDVHFFSELMSEETLPTTEKEHYLSEVW